MSQGTPITNRAMPRQRRPLLALLLVMLLLLPFGIVSADTDNANLPGGTSISVAITSPTDGVVLPPGPVSVTGTASVGQGLPVPNTALVYVLDVSGSTVIPASSGPGCGGNQNGDTFVNSVLDCEIAAAKALNAQAVALGTVADSGVAFFAASGGVGDVSSDSGTQTITAPGSALDTVFSSAYTSNSGGSAGLAQFTNVSVNAGNTNFAAGITNAVTVANASSKPNKIVVFLSDGEATTGGNVSTALGSVPPGVKFFTFAVGSASSCDGNPSGLGSLRDIANATGGTCTQVSTAANLPNILPGVIASQITSLSMTVDGNPAAIGSISPALPQNGPVSVNFSATLNGLAAGSHTVCVTANGSDGGGPGNVTDCHTFTINAPPVVNPGGPYAGDEGSAIALSGVVTDSDGPSLTTTWSYSAGAGVDAGATCNITDASAPVTSITCTDDGTYNLTLTANDSVNPAVVANTTVVVANVAPSLTIGAPATGSLYAVNTAVNLTSSFTDPGSNDTHTCTIVWDDGSTSGPFAATANACNQSHTFTAAGVYTIAVTVTDDDGGVDTETVLVVVYDPSAGFVTGGGWIDSPAGAYKLDPTLSGRANFGFVSKYQKGATVPTGQTEFQFKAGNLNFHSDSYEYLVVAGAKAQYKGTGTLNGVAGYRFILTVTDGQQQGGGGVDMFRIRIWEPTGGLIYDNGSGSEDIDASTEQAISGGSIVIHKGK